MKAKHNRNYLITEIARRAGFTKSDVELILETMIAVFVDIVKDNAILSVRSFGKLYTQMIPARKGRKGADLAPATRVVFKLSENIRYAEKRDRKMME